MENYITMTWDCTSIPDICVVFLHGSQGLEFSLKGEFKSTSLYLRELWKKLPLDEKRAVLSSVAKSADIILNSWNAYVEASKEWDNITGEEEDSVYDFAESKYNSAMQKMYDLQTEVLRF